MNFQGSGIRIDDFDIPRIGHMVGVGEDEIHAVMDIEAAGSGFDKSGRLKMLFEPHVFYRNLSGAKRDAAVREGLAYSAWRPGAYPADSYPRLLRAIAIDETAALKSCSWGLGQIMGENFAAAGYQTPQAMVADFCRDEANQLEAMVRFIKANKLDDDLRRHDWAGFARGYNGAGYAKHGYHTKLAAAFAKWQRIKDTPWTPGAVAPAKTPPTTAATKGAVIVGSAIGTGATANEMKKSGASNWSVGAVIVLGVVLAVVIIIGIRKFKKG